MGTIGTGVYEQINKETGRFSETTSIPAKITKILDKDPTKHADDALITNNPSDILDDDEIEIVIALMGGSDFEFEQIKEALKHKKHVITANKAVIGAHFDELTKLAKDNNVMLRYEASVGGGIPIIKSLEDELRNNEISEIKGILNGTTNFILTKMIKDRSEFTDSLKEAQAIGFAEANPDADILGHDAARKIAILSSLAYGSVINDEDIKQRGIQDITSADITEANRMGYTIKHIGQSINDNGKVSIVVEPILVRHNSIMSGVNNEFNIISIKGNIIDELQYYGKGAGKDATANAIVSDVLDVIHAIDIDQTIPQPEFNQDIELVGNDAFHGEYFIRIDTNNSKGYDLSTIMDNLGEITEIKHINSSNGRIFIFTEDVESKKIENLINEFDLKPEEIFFARISD